MCVFACVRVHRDCCRHFSPNKLNASWQLWIRLLAIQGYSPHCTHTHTQHTHTLIQTHTRTNLCFYSINLVLHTETENQGIALMTIAVLCENLRLCCHRSPLRNVRAVAQIQSASGHACVVCFWRHFPDLYVPVTVDFFTWWFYCNDQLWGLTLLVAPKANSTFLQVGFCNLKG